MDDFKIRGAKPEEAFRRCLVWAALPALIAWSMRQAGLLIPVSGPIPDSAASAVIAVGAYHAALVILLGYYHHRLWPAIIFAFVAFCIPLTAALGWSTFAASTGEGGANGLVLLMGIIATTLAFFLRWMHLKHPPGRTGMGDSR